MHECFMWIHIYILSQNIYHWGIQVQMNSQIPILFNNFFEHIYIKLFKYPYEMMCVIVLLLSVQYIGEENWKLWDICCWSCYAWVIIIMFRIYSAPPFKIHYETCLCLCVDLFSVGCFNMVQHSSGYLGKPRNRMFYNFTCFSNWLR